MSKVAHYLQEHLIGEVITSADARRYFSTDTSIFTLAPAIIVYPRNENDVRKTARFAWQLAERGRVIPITARGSGTDQTGAAIGSGIMMVFPAHMNKILELDPKTGSVAIQPGLNYGKLQQTLHTHGRFLPPFPASLEFSTLGGAIANNAGGEKSIKYGSTRDFVRSLRVVLANGEVIETRRIGKRELSKKLGLNSLEGEIYRALDSLIEENKELISQTKRDVSKNSSGYALTDVKRKDGSFDLTPLIVGSQGTLAIVTEAIIETEAYVPSSSLVIAGFDSVEAAVDAIDKLRRLPSSPSALEIVDEHLLNFIDKNNPNQLKGVLEKPFSKALLLIEFDEANARNQKKLVKKTKKIVEEKGGTFQVETELEQQEQYWKIRQAATTVMTATKGDDKALPVIEDGVVPIDKLSEFIESVYELLKKYGLEIALWGHAGDGNIHLQPSFSIGQLGDRQKIFKLMKEYHDIVISLGGSISGQHGDGRLRGPYLSQAFGQEAYDLFEQVKTIFDPHGTLNPGVKTGVTTESVKPLIRSEYSLSHIYDHLPRT